MKCWDDDSHCIWVHDANLSAESRDGSGRVGSPAFDPRSE
jgi:hypothetical protein